MAVKAIPDGYFGAQPYLSIAGAAEALEFYKKAFGAEELLRIPMPDGKIGHAEMKIDHAIIMMADEFPDMGFRSPKALGGTPVLIHIYVEDVDALAKRAIAAGIKVTRPVSDQFYGDRTVGFEDPYGHSWYFATHTRDVSPEELQQGAAAQAKERSS